MKRKKPLADNEGRIVGDVSDLEAEAEAADILAGAEIKPGTWHERGEVKQRVEEIWDKPQYSPTLIKVCRAYEQIFGTPRKVFYPSCNIDASPVRGFPDSKITLLDRDESAAKIMREAGLPILNMPVEQYSGEKHDLILLLNQVFHPSLVVPHLAEGGRILANNYHHAASNLRDMGHILIGGFDFKEDNPIFVQGSKVADIDQYFVFGGRGK